MIQIYSWSFQVELILEDASFLALQIASQMCIKMIKDYCVVSENPAELEDYHPMIYLSEKVDRLVDIMNGIGFSKGKHRDVQLINTPRHCHSFELFGILCLFEEQKKVCGGFNTNFITVYTYENLM